MATSTEHCSISETSKRKLKLNKNTKQFPKKNRSAIGVKYFVETFQVEH